MSRNSLVDELTVLFSETGAVRTRETSKSWVFLTPDRVFKLKKPLRDGVHDLTSLRARHDNTLTEIDLNRRLAPETYLGAVRVGRLPSGALALDDPGAVCIDWLVEMRRLPEERMLDQRLSGGTGGTALDAEIDALVPVLAAFYAAAPVCRLTGAELLTLHESQLDLARNVLFHPLFHRHHPQAQRVIENARGFLPRMADLLDTRARAGRIVEGHGDLRPEHVCLTAVPVIYDCLEFNRTLRMADPYSELAFLGLECALLGARWIGPRLVDAMEPALGPRPDERLRIMYETLHAIVRARLCFAHMLQQTPRTPERWIPLGQRYLALAGDRLDQLDSICRTQAARAGARDTTPALDD